MKIVRRTLVGLVGALALGLTTTACSSGSNVPEGVGPPAVPPGAHPAPTTVVVMEHYSFAPAVVTIKAGQTIEWSWRDPRVPHNVTFANFHSATKINGVYYHTFTTPGAYPYFCTLHYNMTGEVIVTPG